jgi:hypothetical protein
VVHVETKAQTNRFGVLVYAEHFIMVESKNEDTHPQWAAAAVQPRMIQIQPPI